MPAGSGIADTRLVAKSPLRNESSPHTISNVTESALDRGPHTRDTRSVLIEGKLSARSPREGAVSRRALIERARRSEARVVGVTAPAGYGKSMLLAEWAASEDRAIGWVSLDRFDDDPAALLAVLAAAGADFSTTVADVADDMRGVGASLLGRAAPLLGEALARAETPFVLFIDDAHVAASDQCHDVLEVVLSRVPAGSQVVLASRHELPYFARLRAQGTTWEIGAHDLRIDVAGARVIFDDVGYAASDSDLEHVVARCEGWPAGMFLSALAANAGADLEGITGDERFVADYLYRECLLALPDDLQRFLRWTSILDELSGPLCDAVMDSVGSSEMLRRVADLNLFLVSLDRTRRWFRFHALFSDFLRAELERTDAEVVPALHQRAADWFEQNGAPDRAVNHLLRLADRERAAALVAEVALPMYQRGEVAITEGWLAEIGDATIEKTPELAVIAAWTAILQGRSPASERWAAILDRVPAPTDSAEHAILFESARAMVRAGMCLGGADQVLRDARFAVEVEPEWSVWRDQALHLLGAALLLHGDVDAATDAFVEASRLAAAAGNWDTIILSDAELAILAIARGDLDEAEVRAASAVRAIDEGHMEGYPTTALALAVHARVAIQRDDAAGAQRFLARSMRARVDCTHVMPYLAIRTRLHLAMAHAAVGERPAAMHLLREIDGVLARRPDVGVLREEVEEFRAALTREASEGVSIPLTPAELRLLPYLQTHLSIAEIGTRLFVSRNTVSSQVGSIYRKLGVTSRSGAVERAMAAGLLGR